MGSVFKLSPVHEGKLTKFMTPIVFCIDEDKMAHYTKVYNVLKVNDLLFEKLLNFDLGFMCELGEYVKRSRIRVIFGMQEKLFENPSFAFVSMILNRVKDPFYYSITHEQLHFSDSFILNNFGARVVLARK
ncbi:MAG TPA: hypothetical protein GXZ27_09595 [Thermoanaerobacterales bacterium]|nr:hypothetical protein [Thermoanaerobacterales bacterium]